MGSIEGVAGLEPTGFAEGERTALDLLRHSN
jgi:hypothetical protein